MTRQSRLSGRMRRLFFLIGLSWLVGGVNGCKDKKEVPKESPRQSPSSERSMSKPETGEPETGERKASEPACEFLPSPSTPPKQPTVTRAGSTDRDGDVTLVPLAKSLQAAIERTDRVSSDEDARAALAEAITARQSIPSPAHVAAMGKAAGPNGETVAARIEAMRAQLDRAFERLDQRGAGAFSPAMLQNPTMSQNVVIE